VATYALQETCGGNFTGPADGTDDANAFPLGSKKNATDNHSGGEIPSNQAGTHRHHADHQSDMWNTSPDREGIL
jgi:hypothetical protein